MLLIYWLGVLIVSFATILMCIASRVDDEQLPIDRENFMRGLLFLSIIGALLMAGSNCSLNLQRYYEDKIFKHSQNL